ncbi:TIGR03089 family protein [Phycicoccus sp. HDW14]|uniref:TIGR03089 family protein n=1 Tax=Phycicoccus sp. HDW14 TaxID=2714941 RepID=UPI00140C19B3|nr:TIGR03089 family protein [Phycicoccus sp. HDW14]QIM21456.1 TIGR03089 family protein [Phycicoccus sp. HDW14]
MAPTAPAPAALLARLVAADPGRPRITVYDDTDGPTRGERIELSARVLANWVAKAGNLLQDELDAGPGTVVRLALPPHWRTLYWAFAAWSVGACVEVAGTVDDGSGADVVVTDDPARGAGAEHLVVVTLAALARQSGVEVPTGAVDEARELATHGDVLLPLDEPDPDDVALRSGGVERTFGEVVPVDATGGRVHTATADTAELLRLALTTWAGDGSLVLSRGTPDPEVLRTRLASEGVTATA